jgi:hypothetical protein
MNRVSSPDVGARLVGTLRLRFLWLPHPPDPVNPSPAVSVFTALVLAMLVWMVWLLVRPVRSE